MELTDQPVEICKGMRVWSNSGNGYVAVLLHYSSDPLSPSKAERWRSCPDKATALREHELDFSTWSGKAVYSGFDRGLHVDENIGYIPGLPVWVGLDFGYHHPAAIFMQIGGEVWVLGEVMGEDMTLDQFMRRVFIPYQQKLFPEEDTQFLYAADPAGKQVSDKSEHTSFQLLSNFGIFPVQRRSEIAEGLTLIRQRLELGLLKVHPRCKIFIEGASGGYRYPDPSPGIPEPRYPKKDGYFDHLQDCARYVCVNAMSLITPKPKDPPKEPTWVEKMVKPRQFDDLALLSD